MPTSFRVLVAIVLAEAVGAWVYLGYLALAVGGDPGGWRVAGYFALYAVAFTILAVGLLRRRRWVRAPLIVLQLLLSVIGASLVAAGTIAGLPLVVIPVACVGLLLTSTTRTALS